MISAEKRRTSIRLAVPIPAFASMLPERSRQSMTQAVCRSTVLAVMGMIHSRPVSVCRTVTLPAAVAPAVVPV